MSAPGRPSIRGRRSPRQSSTRERGADLEVGRGGLLSSEHAIRGQRVHVIELRGQAGQVLGQPHRGDPVVLPRLVHVLHREVGARRIELPRAAEGAHRLGPEVHRSPRQPPAEVLQLLVAPALGLAHLLGVGFGEERGIGRDLFEPLEDAPGSVHRLVVHHQPRHRGVALPVELGHLLAVRARLEVLALVGQALELQGRLRGHAGMRGGEAVKDEPGGHGRQPTLGWNGWDAPASARAWRPRASAWAPPPARTARWPWGCRGSSRAACARARPTPLE